MGQAIAKGTAPLHTQYTDNGFVEQDPEEIYQNVLASAEQCLAEFENGGHDKEQIVAIGISNQRETFVVWDKTGKPLYNAVVWQCKRSVDICESLRKQNLGELINQKTGLLIDPYFSATKLMWLAQYNKNVNEAIQSGNAYFGTIDTWLLYKFTGGLSYATDYTNASRTLLFNLHTLLWDEELISLFGLNGINLPVLKSSAALFGDTTVEGLFDSPVPVTAMIGDSHAAAFGEGCFDPGSAKVTLGTGCSILMNVGNTPVVSQKGMVTTICWSMENKVVYALEGVIVSCGSSIEWLKNELQLFSDSRQTAAMANAVPDAGGVILVPAFSGLGSPHWQMERRASLTGMSFGTTKNHIVRAALECISFQVRDVIDAMEKDAGISLKELKANGGMTANDFVIQFLSDLLNKHIIVAGIPDVSALGAAYLAGLQARVYEHVERLEELNDKKRVVIPLAPGTAAIKYQGWREQIRAYVKGSLTLSE
jgi:glycerol kinase